MNENITPLPWAIGETPSGKGKVTDQHGFSVCNMSGTTYTQNRANAAFIVTAVNAHPTLTARVKELEEALEEIHERLMKCMDDTISAREAYDSFYQDIAMSALNKEPTT